MRKVIGIGETVLDIIFRGQKPVQAVPGGSAFNAIISLGRCGVPAAFISETGNDRVGLWVRTFLENNGVDASAVCVFPDSKSPISLAFLDEQNNAEYLFYKDHPHDRIDFKYPEINADDIVIFGSFFAINPVVRPQVAAFLEYAHAHGAILYYDLNYRASHRNDLMRVTPAIIENLELADIVRGSNEDFEIMYKKTTADAVYRSEIAFYTHNFIYTRGADPVELRAEGGLSKQYAVKADGPVVSTIGAGDNFNAGLVYGLIKNGITRQQIVNGLAEEQWDRVMDCALEFSAQVCRTLDNYVPREFGERSQLSSFNSL
jgi:fructokinase